MLVKHFLMLSMLSLVAAAPVSAFEYLVAVEKNCGMDPAWLSVGESLATTHAGECASWDGTEAGLLALLKKYQPRYLAIVGKPETFQAATVRGINRATRMVDDDPWTDCRWGLITGRTADDAKNLAKKEEPLTIDRALCTTGIDLGLVDSAMVISDGGKGGYTVKEAGKEPKNETWSEEKTPGGTVTLFADYWDKQEPQLVVSSSHATQFNLEMPFSLGLLASHGGHFHVLTQQQRNSFARFLGGAMFTGKVKELGDWIDTTKAPTLKNTSSGPRVWVASGNCLIGDAKGTSESMVVTALSSAGFKQFVGYVVPTWFGRGGWGISDLWQASRGGLSLSESYFLNEQALIDETITRFPGAEKINFDGDDIEQAMKSDRKFISEVNGLESKGIKIGKDVIGLIHDRDVIAFWGDPLWSAKFDATRKPHALTAAWAEKNGKSVLTLTAKEDFSGKFPQWLPQRMHAPTMAPSAGAEVDAFVADDFLMIRKVTLKKGETITIEISAN